MTKKRKGGAMHILEKRVGEAPFQDTKGGEKIRKHVAGVQQEYETGARGGGRRVRHHEDCPCGVIEKDCGGHDEHS